MTKSFFPLLFSILLCCFCNKPVGDIPPGGSTTPDDQNTLLLISLDGFHPSYFDLVETPALSGIIKNGVKASALIPVFPSKTFPNHYTQVTGLYPENHGIISNTMYNESTGDWFRIGTGSTAVKESRWYGGEPIWVTAEKQGLKAATYFWPGSEAEIKGVRPSLWKVFNGGTPHTERVLEVLSWLRRPAAERPRFISLYFSTVDQAGHSQGPGSEAVKQAVKEIDLTIDYLLDRIEPSFLEEQLDIIIVSDHGMSQLSRDRVIFLDDYIDLNEVLVVDISPVATLRPDEGEEEKIYRLLHNAHPKLQVFKKSEVPSSYHFNQHPLIPPIIAIADDGWSISSHSIFNDRPNSYTGGNHGYDPVFESMNGIFVASGPSFKSGLDRPALHSIHLYELMCKVLELTPAENDGNLSEVEDVLAD